MSGATSPRIGLIWAEADGGVIGKDGVMPWHVPEDLAHFKRVTLGSPVVMGRKTWDSLPARFRPLLGRRNIVVTRQPEWTAEGVDVVHSVDAALALATSGLDGIAAVGSVAGLVIDDFIWVLGGAEIFRSVIDRADRLEVTRIRARFEGDTTAPTIGSRWSVVAEDPGSAASAAPSAADERIETMESSGTRWFTSRSGPDYRFLRYELR